MQAWREFSTRYRKDVSQYCGQPPRLNHGKDVVLSALGKAMTLFIQVFAYFFSSIFLTVW